MTAAGIDQEFNERFRMPSFVIAVNGTRVATIDLAELDVADVSVHGALDAFPKTRMNAAGSRCAASGSSHWIWIAEHALLPGDVLRVTLRDQCDNADRGKTIAELYPDEAPCTITDFSITEEMATEIRARPRLHDDFSVHAETSAGQQASATSDDLHTEFSFGLLWDSFHPSQARVRLSTYCFDDVLARTGGTTHLQTMIGLGDSASFVLVR
jgi:hypothetical protein